MSADVINFSAYPAPQGILESEGYRCCQCGVWMYHDIADKIERDARICTSLECRDGKLGDLLKLEAGARRLGELLTMKRQYSITDAEKLKQLEQVVYAIGLAGVIGR